MRKGSLVYLGAAIFLFLMLESPIALAANGQDPNRQITNAKASQDFTSWIRLSMTTAAPFHFTSGTNEYTLQLNGLTNGGVQGVAIADSRGGTRLSSKSRTQMEELREPGSPTR
jgi:hypothetical protein